jgi:hypothetical protein
MGKLGQVSIQFVFCCVLLCVVVCCCAVLVLVVVVGCCVLLWVAVYSEGLLCVVVCCSVLWCVVVCCCVCVVVCVLWYVLLYVLLYVVVCDVVLSGLLGLCKACTKGERAWGEVRVRMSCFLTSLPTGLPTGPVVPIGLIGLIAAMTV